MTVFALKLEAETARCGAPLCVGLDPFPDRIPALFGPPGSLAAVEAFCKAILSRLPGRCAALKPQLGLFEPFGPEGVALARDLTWAASRAGLPVILDAKRGDIGTTAEGYAAAALGAPPGFDADCVTVNPYMGLDTLEPFLALAEGAGKGVAVLVRTSNPGARDFQDLNVDGAPLFIRVAEKLRNAESRLASTEGFSNLMIVVGATWPEEARRLRSILPRALFLVPGFGAQGGTAQDAMAGAQNGRGVIVNASRSVLYPPAAANALTAAAWDAVIDEALDQANDQLGKAG